MLKIYNSLTRKKEPFIHSKKRLVKLYVCGITPYDTTHLGHAFTYVFFDVLVRYLQYKGYRVNYVQNVTDIDDDILREAKKSRTDWKEFGNFWTEQYLTDLKALNVLPPTHFAKATDSIATMIRIIRVLVDKGLAYQKGGNVYFNVGKFGNYGHLSKFNRQQMMILAKERGGNPSDPLKKDSLDFILWQQSKKGDPSWPFKFGKEVVAGRPGWHIECSAMVNQYLGETIDIHGGGRDLIFPHHESEIAQSESFTGKKPFSRFFIHTAMVLCHGEKMSKSLKNLVMVDTLLKKYHPNVIRWYLLSHSYRQPFDYQEEDLVEADRWVRHVEKRLKTASNNHRILQQFEQIMDNDVNTPKALELLSNSPDEKLFKILGFVVK